jgi:Ca2+/H+ antiporter
MNIFNHVLALVLVCAVSATSVFANQSTTQTYKVSFTIPVTVSEQPSAKAIETKQQMITQQREMRLGQMVNVITIVVP